MNTYKPFHPFDMGPVEFGPDPELQERMDELQESIRLN